MYAIVSSNSLAKFKRRKLRIAKTNIENNK